MEIAVPQTAEDAKPAQGTRPADMAHKLILEETQEGRWSSAKTAGIAWRCMVLAGLMLAVFNSGSVLDASRKLPMGPLRIYGERVAESWNGLMTEVGATRFRDRLHATVQAWRVAPWPKLVWPEKRPGGEERFPFPRLVPGSGPNEVKEALRKHTAQVIDNRSLLQCIQSTEFRDAVTEQYLVKRQMEDPGFAAVSRRTLERDPEMAKAAENICGFRASNKGDKRK